MDKNENLVPVIAGLAVGVLLIIVMSLVFKPAISLSDGELIHNSMDIKEVQYFLSKYPEAIAHVARYNEPSSGTILVTFDLERDIYEPAGDGPDDFGRTAELALVLEYHQDTGAGINRVPKMYVSCGGPISDIAIGDNVTKQIDEMSICLEKRLATNIYPQISRVEALDIARKHTLETLVPSHKVIEFKEIPNFVLLPENKTISPLIYVAENGTHFLINETNDYAPERPCNLSDQELCYTGDRDSQPFIVGHLVYVMDVAWQEDDVVGGGTRYMIDASTGKFLYPPLTDVTSSGSNFTVR